MLYGLQLASNNTRRLRNAGVESIQNIVIDGLGREVAAPADDPDAQ
jgi:hypothetical protein